MNPFGRSLSMDFVDIYNDTWSFLLLLFLTLVTWLLPLIPSLHLPPTSRGSAPYLPRETSAQCWCPMEFTGSMIAYTNAICGAVFDQALRGAQKSSDNQGVGAALYIYGDQATEWEPFNITTEKEHNAHCKNCDSGIRFAYFMSVKTPIILFIFALCLKLPQFIWMQFSFCFGANLNKSLETLKRDHGHNAGSEPDIKEGLLSFSKNHSSSSAAFWYIVLKSMRCVIAMAVCVILRSYLQPELAELEKAINVEKRTAEPETDYSNRPLICDIRIMKLSNLQTWSIQCVFVKNKLLSVTQDAEEMSLLVYKALYAILLVAFIVLTCVNIVNLFALVTKLLVRRCRLRMTKDASLPLDAYLLLHLAQENLGPLAADKLSETFSNFNETGPNNDSQ